MMSSKRIVTTIVCTNKCWCTSIGRTEVEHEATSMSAIVIRMSGARQLMANNRASFRLCIGRWTRVVGCKGGCEIILRRGEGQEVVGGWTLSVYTMHACWYVVRPYTISFFIHMCETTFSYLSSLWIQTCGVAHLSSYYPCPAFGQGTSESCCGSQAAVHCHHLLRAFAAASPYYMTSAAAAAAAAASPTPPTIPPSIICCHNWGNNHHAIHSACTYKTCLNHIRASAAQQGQWTCICTMSPCRCPSQ